MEQSASNIANTTKIDQNAEIIASAIKNSLSVIEQERERIIITHRFGLTGPRETLEEIGESLSITRERVRQLEKAILVHLHIAAEEGTIEGLSAAEKLIIRNLTEVGRIARTSALAEKILATVEPTSCAELNFLATISNSLCHIEETDRYYSAIAISEYGSDKDFKERADKIVSIIKKQGEPMTVDQLDELTNYEHPSHIAAIASIAKPLAELNGFWGLNKWPTVNPKNIRDKIFVILSTKNEPMHFSEIADAIKQSNFKRKNVTTQAIHNELIKDSRFVLIGRGIYALNTWGYKEGTVSEIITAILKEKGEPMTREEIVREVLHSRKVKETTILLNLQNKKLFHKIDKNSYELAEP